MTCARKETKNQSLTNPCLSKLNIKENGGSLYQHKHLHKLHWRNPEYFSPTASSPERPGRSFPCSPPLFTGNSLFCSTPFLEHFPLPPRSRERNQSERSLALLTSAAVHRRRSADRVAPAHAAGLPAVGDTLVLFTDARCKRNEAMNTSALREIAGTPPGTSSRCSAGRGRETKPPLTGRSRLPTAPPALLWKRARTSSERPSSLPISCEAPPAGDKGVRILRTPAPSPLSRPRGRRSLPASGSAPPAGRGRHVGTRSRLPTGVAPREAEREREGPQHEVTGRRSPAVGRERRGKAIQSGQRGRGTHSSPRNTQCRVAAGARPL